MDSLTKSMHSFFFSKLCKLLIILCVSFFVVGDTTLANDATPTDADSDNIISIIAGILAMVSGLLGFITAMIGMLMYPGWTNGTLFGLQEYLRIIWILVSNVVYFVFAFILIVIAFMNIINKGEGNWELKQALPRFIIGVLIVPFTWFLVQFILSISGVLTYAVLTLPYDVFRDQELFEEALNDEYFSEPICTSYILYLQKDPEGGYEGESLGDGLDESFRCEGDKKELREIMSGEDGTGGLQSSVFGIISVYTYGILKVDGQDTVSWRGLRTIRDIIDLGLDAIFKLLFVIVYLILMIALFLALLVRGIQLWIYTMLSPLFGLMYFFGKSSEGMGRETSKKYNLVEFIHLAFVPVYVSAALAFGLTFIVVATMGIQQNACEEDCTTIEVGGISLRIEGAHGSGSGDETEELNPIGKFIIEIFGLVILWVAVMAALNSSKATEAVVKPIHEFGQSMGRLAAASPTYMPIIPTGDGGMSVAGLGTMGQSIESTVAANARGTGSRLGTTFGEALSGGSNSTSTLNAQASPYREGVRNGDRVAIDRTLAAMAEQTNSESLGDRQFRERFLNELSNILRDNEGQELLTPELRRDLIDATVEDFPDRLARALNSDDINGNLRGESREQLRAFFNNNAVGSLQGSHIVNAFGITSGDSGDNTPTTTHDGDISVEVRLEGGNNTLNLRRSGFTASINDYNRLFTREGEDIQLNTDAEDDLRNLRSFFTDIEDSEQIRRHLSNLSNQEEIDLLISHIMNSRSED